MASNSENMFGPLNFSNNKKNETKTCTEIQCLFCTKLFKFDSDKDEYLAHLFREHRLVISDVADIPLLPDYLIFWKDKFHGKTIEEYCSTMLMDKLPDGSYSKDEKYYLLSDIVIEDKEIRLQLSKKKLEQVLTQYQFERTDQNFQEDCLYCRDVVSPNRVAFLEHLYQKHFLQLGKPENLVFIDELIQVVKTKLEKFVCLYCEKIFRDRPTLKEHMRKKGHKRINPDNKFYDKYFLINYKNDLRNKNKKYAQPSTSEPQNTDKETLFNTESDSDSDWSDWSGEGLPINCLFCSTTDREFEGILQHMQAMHDFDFSDHVKELNFYQKIKVVNYIRRQIHLLKCPNCGSQEVDLAALRAHIDDQKHAKFNISEHKWDQPEFFFPTYEDDSFLCFLDNDSDNVSRSEEDSGVVVISEESTVNVNLEAERLSKENFMLS